MKTPKYLFIFVGLFLLTFLMGGVIAVDVEEFGTLGGREGSCPFNEGEYDHVVDFNPTTKLLSNSNSSHSTSLKSVSLPAGTYEVYLYSWDGYPGRVGSSQSYEQYKVLFFDGGINIANSSASVDLTDNVAFAEWEGMVDSGLILASDVDAVQGYHDDYYSSNPNSLYAECAAFNEIKEETVNVVAHKIICESEDLLPNWGSGGDPIGKYTADDFVDETDGCELAEDWEFQWRVDGSNPGDNESCVDEDGWNTFGPTGSDGEAETSIPLPVDGTVKLRECLQEGYLGFSGANGGDVSAEFYCNGDVFKYDNWDWIKDDLVDGDTQYCVAFNVELRDDTPPTCTVDYLDGNTNFDLVDNYTYIDEAGYYTAYGTGTDETEIDEDTVQANRTSDDSRGFRDWIFEDVSRELFNSNDTYVSWYVDFPTTQGRDDYYDEGEHQICCELEDVAGNDFRGGCKSFCIDEVSPETPEISYSDDCTNSEEYYNGDIIFSWTNESDEGCAPVWYMVKIYENDNLIHTLNTSDTSINLNDHITQVNGNNYSIKVKSYDLSGNTNELWTSSVVIWFDSENPVVEITGQPWDVWYNEDFNVSESDTDNFGIFSVEYKVHVVGDGAVVDWTEIDVNETVTVQVPEECYKSGLNKCWVYKRAEDLACNVDETYKKYDIDLDAPNTTKEVSNPKYPGPNFLYPLVHWFIKPETTINLTCDDGEGVGCNNTYYRIDGGNWTIYSAPFSVGTEDREYFIEYYSDDLLGNTEAVLNETDKIDTIPPVTLKTYGPSTEEVMREFWGYRVIPQFDLEVWMHFLKYSNFNITLNASDSEVGVNGTYYQILVPSEFGNLQICTANDIGCDGPEAHTEYYCGEGENGYWYETEQEGMNCTATSWVVVEEDMYTEPIHIDRECDHKICYWSEDHLGNQENVSCQVFSIDGQGPVTAIINPTVEYGASVTACVLPIDIKISDDKSGVASADAELSNDSGVVWTGALEKYINLEDGTEWWYYPDSADLTGWPAGNYTLKIIGEDNVGNVVDISERNVTLEAGIFVVQSQTKGCEVGEEGGLCILQYHACVRGQTDMNYSMTKLLDRETGEAMELASLADLQATLVTESASGYVGLIDHIPGNITELRDLECGVINDMVAFNVTLNFSETLIQNIGGGSYYFDWALDSFDNGIPCEVIED